MRILKMDEVDSSVVEDIRNGRVFVYPTDTIYGIGCNALLDDAVKKVFCAKKRDESCALSVIAPSFEWIGKYCDVDMDVVRKYLPGPYTLIVRKKDAGFLFKVCGGKGTLGVRIIEHPIMKHFEVAGVPFVTTSVNVSGDAPVCDVSKISDEIMRFVDVVIDYGVIEGRASTLIDLSEGDERVVGR